MKILDPVTLVICLALVVWLVVSRVRKKLIRSCFVEVMEKDGKKLPLDYFKETEIRKGPVRRCGSLRVKRKYNTILPNGERVSFFVWTGGKRRFRYRIYDVSKTICCECPSCRTITCIDVKIHSSISVIHGYWIILKKKAGERLDIGYENEFHPSERTFAAIAEYGKKLQDGHYLRMDATGNLPPRLTDIATTAIEEFNG